MAALLTAEQRKEARFLAQEAVRTTELAKRFSKSSGKPVILTGLLSTGAAYTWAVPGIREQVAQQVSERELERFTEAVALGHDAFETASKLFGQGKLKWLVKTVLVDVPSRIMAGDGFSGFDAVPQSEIEARLREAVPLSQGHRLLFVDSSDYKAFPKSFTLLKKLLLKNGFDADSLLFLPALRKKTLSPKPFRFPEASLKDSLKKSGGVRAVFFNPAVARSTHTPAFHDDSEIAGYKRAAPLAPSLRVESEESRKFEDLVKLEIARFNKTVNNVKKVNDVYTLVKKKVEK